MRAETHSSNAVRGSGNVVVLDALHKRAGIMTEAASPATPRLWTPEGFHEDEWVRAEGADALAGNERVVLPLQVFLDLDAETRRAAKARLGVVLQAGDPLERILPFLGELSLIALDFPRFNDGRSFSKAEVLRSRHRFEGALRAVGDVLIDQIPLMLRVGFDQFEVTNTTTLARLEAGRLNGIPFHSQPVGKAPAEAGRFSWRRQAKG